MRRSLLHPAAAQVRAREVVGDRELGRADADVGRALDEDLVADEQVHQLGEGDGLELAQELAGGAHEAVRQVVADPAHPVVVVEQARAAGPLEQVEDLLAVAEQVQEGREGADVHAVGAHRDAVRGDALQLGHDHADGGHVGRDLDPHQLLDGQRVAERVAHGGAVVHAVRVGDDARVVDVLGVLLEAAVQVADVRPRRAHHLAVGLELDAQHAVGGRVLRPHVEDHLVVSRSSMRQPMRGLGAHDSSTWRLGGVTSKGPTPIFSPARARSAICGVGFTCMPL